MHNCRSFGYAAVTRSANRLSYCGRRCLADRCAIVPNHFCQPRTDIADNCSLVLASSAVRSILFALLNVFWYSRCFDEAKIMSKFVGQPGVNAKERRSSLRIISRNDDTKFERNFTNTQLWKGRTANIGKMKRSIPTAYFLGRSVLRGDSFIG